MPWNETDVMTEKERFIMLAQTGHFTISDLCTDFGISRKTGHKYLQRYQADGRLGLSDRSRRPKYCSFATEEAVENLILKERRKHPTWGAKKIHDLLLKVHGLEHRPHINTVHNILNRHGVKLRVKCTSNLRIKVYHFDDEQHHQNGTTRSNHRAKGPRLERS